MAKPGAGPRFFKRRGHDLTVKDAEGGKHHAVIERIDAPAQGDGSRTPGEPGASGSSDDLTQDGGAFAFGYCKSCDWTGPARRARDKARKDAVAHRETCPGKGRVRLGISEDDPR